MTVLERRLNYSYTYNPSSFGDKSHTYELVGRDGAIHFHVTEAKNGEFYGGIEEHHRTCPTYSDRPPSHTNCRLLGGPCWHDGSSLYASEVLIPMWKLEFPNHDAVFAALVRDYDRVFRREHETVEA